MKPCRCREPRRHRDCAYCGTGISLNGEKCCGVCKEADIDLPTIRGTTRVVCADHKQEERGEA